MEIEFTQWKKYVEGATIESVKATSSHAILIEFNTGMLSYIESRNDGLVFDYNWKPNVLGDMAVRQHIEQVVKKIREIMDDEDKEK